MKTTHQNNKKRQVNGQLGARVRLEGSRRNRNTGLGLGGLGIRSCFGV